MTQTFQSTYSILKTLSEKYPEDKFMFDFNPEEDKLIINHYYGKVSEHKFLDSNCYTVAPTDTIREFIGYVDSLLLEVTLSRPVYD